MNGDTLELAHEISGSGPALLILHGLFGSGRNWQSVARELSARYTVVTVDARNHGRSPHSPEMDYAAMTRDLEALLNSLDLHEVTLLGHSMGGKTAMTHALTHPARVARLVVVDIALTPSSDQHTPMIDAMLALPPEVLARRAEAERQLRQAVPEDDVRLFLLTNLSGGAWRVNLPALRAHMPELIGALPVPATARYTGPACFIRGELSNRVMPEHASDIRRHFPAASLHTVPEGGHWPHSEAPRAFMRALEDSLFF